MSEVAKQTKKQMVEIAKQHDKQVIEFDNAASRALPNLGWVAVDMVAGNEFHLLGFGDGSEVKEDEKAYRMARGISRSTWYRYKGLAEKARESKIQLKEYLTLAPGKWELLCKYLGLEDRSKDKWLAKAAKKNIRVTEDDLEEELKALNPEERGRDNDDDMRETFKARVYHGQLQLIEDAIKRFAQANNLDADDKGRVLELICVEVLHSESVIAAIRDVVPEVRGFLALVKDSDKSAEDTLEALTKRVEDMVLRLAKAAGVKLQQVDPKAVKAAAAAAGPSLVTH